MAYFDYPILANSAKKHKLATINYERFWPNSSMFSMIIPLFSDEDHGFEKPKNSRRE